LKLKRVGILIGISYLRKGDLLGKPRFSYEMPHIKKLVMKGFKSFPRETSIHLDKSMNCVVGPNGSGKSNITDAVCFALGRLSIKSMRAAKSANLIFAGTKITKPATEASVEIVFDNSDKGFAIPYKEVSLKRIVRKNGQGVYKINNAVKTRQEILELLAQAGIDPHGFNIVLQGEIDSFVKMHGDERRKVVEEVAGISVYETRKQKSLKELDKTDLRLKEVSAVLRERTAYLRNLEQERQQALKFKKLELTVKKCKASILKRRLDDKKKDKDKIDEDMHKKLSSLDKAKIIIGKVQEEIQGNNNKIEEINLKIQESSGLEQESLSSEIADLKAEVAGLEVRKENFSSQLDALDKRKQELGKNIGEAQKEIDEMRKSKGKSRKQDLNVKRQQLEDIENKRKKRYSQKSSLSLLEDRINDKNKELGRLEKEASFILDRLESLEAGLEFKDSIEKNEEILISMKKDLEDKKTILSEKEKIILNTEKIAAGSERQIKELMKIKSQVLEIDTCPLCRTKIKGDHKNHIEKESNEKIEIAKKEIKEAETKKSEAWDAKESLIIKLKEISLEKEKREKDNMKLEAINERKQTLRKLQEDGKNAGEELEKIQEEKDKLQKQISQFKNLEEDYDSLKLEVDELARHEEVDVGMEITLKQRELDRMKLIVKQSQREREELEEGILDIESDLEERQEQAEEKEEQERGLQEKFKKRIEEKNKLQDNVRLFESDLLKKQNDSRLLENDVNEFKIKIAEINAQIEGVQEEYKEFEKVEILKLPIPQLQERLQKTQQILSTIGSVNLRALEVYEDIKKEYDAIAEKVEHLNNEKEEILKIIDEIDKKKIKTFNRTLKEINNLFSENFAQLSTKGQATLQPTNDGDVFEGGLSIIIKVGKGKYFDVTSLTGGEQTLIALSLIFAIQEYRPYSFYIFDEIDAALDKRNSERLAMLLRKHMKEGQYLMITHNDALISESSTIYGVSMQEGISKVLSLEV